MHNTWFNGCKWWLLSQPIHHQSFLNVRYLKQIFGKPWIIVKLSLKPWTWCWSKRELHMLFVSSSQVSHVSKLPSRLNPTLSTKLWVSQRAWLANYQGITFDIYKGTQMILMSRKIGSHCRGWLQAGNTEAILWWKPDLHLGKMQSPLFRSGPWWYFKKIWDVGVRTNCNLYIHSYSCTQLGLPPHKIWERLTWSETFNGKHF